MRTAGTAAGCAGAYSATERSENAGRVPITDLHIFKKNINNKGSLPACQTQFGVACQPRRTQLSRQSANVLGLHSDGRARGGGRGASSGTQ